MKIEIPIYDICSISKIEQDDFIISGFAEYAEDNKNLHSAHKHSFYHLVLFTEGSGTHSIDFESFPVKPYQIYFMIPGQVHSWQFNSKVDGYIINFSTSYFQPFLLRSNYLDQFSFFTEEVRDAVIDIPVSFQNEIVHILNNILEVANLTDSLLFKDDKIRILLLQLFFLVAEIEKPKNTISLNSHNLTLLKSFKQLIEKQYKTIRLPKDYAPQLYITPNHLNSVCKDVLGISAGEVIRNRIALEAKRLLVNFELSISEIAYQLNFKDNSYFTKFFKKQTGITPEEFRKKI